MTLTSHLTALHIKGYSLRAYVTGLVAVTLLPVLLLGGWLAFHSAASQRAQIEREAESQARGVAALIDHEITSVKHILTALAGAHLLQTGNLQAFHQRASELARQLGILVVLSDPERNVQVFNTAYPWGMTPAQPVPPERREAQQRARPGEIVISDVFFGPQSGQFLVAALTPVMRDGRIAYFLSVGLPTKRFSEFLGHTAPPYGWVINIVDRRDIVVARSQRNEEFSGTRVRNEFAAKASESGGIHRAIDREGIPTQWTYRRSETTGWFVTVAVPQSMLDAPLKLAFIGYGGAGTLLFGMALALSYYLAGRLSQSLGALGIDRQPTREEFRVLFESAPNGVVVVDADGVMVLANDRMEQKFGYSHDELVGRPVEILIPERFRDGHGALREGFSAAPTMRHMGEGRGLFGRRKNGSEFPIEIGLNPITTRAGDFVMATVVDITARKLAQDKLSAALAERDDLRRRFMQAQEDERLRLAHELHDQTGQNLVAAMMELKGVEPLVTAAARDRLRLLRGQLEEMGKTLHRIARELRPAAIDDLGLITALGNHVSEWSAKIGIETDFHCGDQQLDALPDQVRTTLYRVVQEALTNIAKHAPSATAASVVIDRSDGVLRLTIEDNGGGFDTAARGANGGLGIAGMRERLVLVGGELEVESSAGVGTTLFARIPLEAERVPA